MVRSSDLRQGSRDFDFWFSIHVYFGKIMLVALTALELIFDEFK
jgi:hypothetical protein